MSDRNSTTNDSGADALGNRRTLLRSLGIVIESTPFSAVASADVTNCRQAPEARVNAFNRGLAMQPFPSRRLRVMPFALVMAIALAPQVVLAQRGNSPFPGGENPDGSLKPTGRLQRLFTQDAYTEYALLEPGSEQFRIRFFTEETRVGATELVNATRGGSVERSQFEPGQQNLQSLDLSPATEPQGLAQQLGQQQQRPDPAGRVLGASRKEQPKNALPQRHGRAPGCVDEHVRVEGVHPRASRPSRMSRISSSANSGERPTVSSKGLVRASSRSRPI